MKYFFPAFLILFLTAQTVYGAEGFSLITKDQLKSELGKVTIIDVRTHHDWKTSQWKIKGAQRQSPKDPAKWMSEYPKDKTIVLYCA
jgi:rhodanese-related sulfurtransferase